MENKYYTIINTAVEKLNFQEFDGKLTHKGRDGEPYPSINALYDFINLCRSVIFPGFYGSSIVNNQTFNIGCMVLTSEMFEKKVPAVANVLNGISPYIVSGFILHSFQ